MKRLALTALSLLGFVLVLSVLTGSATPSTKNVTITQVNCSSDIPFVIDYQIKRDLTSKLYQKVIPCLKQGVPQTIILNTIGGEAETTFNAALALIAADTKQVLTTEIQGGAHSSGVILFLTGVQRNVSCFSSSFIHPALFTIKKTTDDTTYLQTQAKRKEEQNKTFANFIAKRSNLDAEEVKAVMEQRDFHYAADLLKYGIATNIINCLE